MCQYLGYDGEVLELGLRVGGSEEREVVQKITRPAILRFGNLTHPRWVIGSGLGWGKVGGVGRGGVGEHIQEESCRDWTEPPDEGIHHHHLLRQIGRAHV